MTFPKADEQVSTDKFLENLQNQQAKVDAIDYNQFSNFDPSAAQKA